MRWLTVDPGEDTGWALWDDNTMLDAGTEKMWVFADALFEAVMGPYMGLPVPEHDSLADRLMGIEMVVCEDFRIYPWEAKAGNLNWDQVRTARLIGAITLITRQGRLEWHLQPAKIKERAEAAGAQSLFLKPLHENRHANDAIMHGVYYQSLQAGARPITEHTDGKVIDNGDDRKVREESL